MHDVQMAERPSLEMRWLPVTDEQGATRMQAVWIDVTPASVTTHHAA
jgi:hypothetical protein